MAKCSSITLPASLSFSFLRLSSHFIYLFAQFSAFLVALFVEIAFLCPFLLSPFHFLLGSFYSAQLYIHTVYSVKQQQQHFPNNTCQ